MSHQNKIINKVNKIHVNEDCIGQRIDNFLFRKLKNVPKSRIYKMLRNGEVRVNKGRVAPLYKLQSGDLIRIPPFWNDACTSVKLKPSDNLVVLLVNNIIYEDDKILVVNKPSGIATHGGSGINFGVIEILRYARPDLKDLELVHRIDRDTSGCLILAKKRSALRELHQLIRNGEIIKKYLLLVRGNWQNKELIVTAALLKNQLRSGERIVKVSKDGKESITIFRPIMVGQMLSLLDAELKTGRTHQIRVHAAHIGYPIVGDEKYGDKDFNHKMRLQGFKRLFLHAKEVKFVWPDGSKINIVAPLDQQLSNTIQHIS